MNLKHPFPIVTALVLASAAAAFAQPNPEQLKHQVLAQAQSLSPDDYAFTKTSQIEFTANGRTRKKVTIEQFDPTKPGRARWALISVNGAAPSSAELKRHRKEVAKRRMVPGYHNVATYFGAPATVASDSDKAVFRFDALPKGALSVIDIDVSGNSSAEALVTEVNGAPLVEQVRLTVKPMRLLFLLHLEQFEITARYGIDPAGQPYLMESTATISGSGLGYTGTMHSTSTYSDYRPERGKTRS